MPTARRSGTLETLNRCRATMNKSVPDTENRFVVVTEAGSYLRLIDFASLNLRLKDLLGPVTRVKKKKKTGLG